MHMHMTWHVEGNLAVKHMFPENGGSITLVDDRGLQLNLFATPALWWMLYCNLPKAKAWHVFRKVGDGTVTITDPAEISEFLLSLLEQRRG